MRWLPIVASLVLASPVAHADNKAVATCLASGPKEPKGKPDKKAKFVGAWSCIGAAGASSGKGTVIFAPGDHDDLKATVQVAFTGGAEQTITEFFHQHGSSLWHAEDSMVTRVDLKSGVVEWLQVGYPVNQCLRIHLTCTKK